MTEGAAPWAPAAALTPQARRAGGSSLARHLAAHWRGELPLVTSFWLHALLPGLLAGMVAGALASAVDVSTATLRTSAWAALAAWPLAGVVQAWGIVGAWRSAGRHGTQPPGVWRARAARVVLALAAAAMLASTALHFAPRAADWLRIAGGFDPAGHLVASLSPTGHRLRLEGPIGIGDAARVTQLLASAPQLRLLELDSPGGRLPEALAIADAIRGRGWTTRIVHACESACALIFLAGDVRQMLPQARLVVRQVPRVTFNPLIAALARSRLGAVYRQAGLPADFVAKSLAMPPALTWHRLPDDLMAQGILTTPGYPLDVTLPLTLPHPAPAIDYADALRTNLVWQALERRHPGSIDAAAERMRAARDAGADTEATLVAGQRVIEDLLARLLFDGGTERREEFLVLLGQQLRAVRTTGGAGCQGVLAGDTAARRALPAALAVRESVWIIDAAAEPPRETAARRPTRLELEVMQRSLGPQAVDLLGQLRRPRDAGGRHCDRVAALIDEILALAPAERRLAMQIAFERS